MLFPMRTVVATLAILLLVSCVPPAKETVQAPKPEVKPIPAPVPVQAPSFWTLLAARTAPERSRIRDAYRYIVMVKDTGIPGLTYMSYRPGAQGGPVGFALTNTGSENINPKGLHGPAMREYKFLFADRAEENLYLKVTDDVAVSGRYSHDNTFRELHFFPRLQLPSVERVAGGRQLKVTLPTGEPVLFDAGTKEIVGGVLYEQPMDFNPNRNARKEPAVSYSGKGLLITVAQRGEDPRLARVWGRTKYAEARYPAKYAKPCRVSPALIWDQRRRPGARYPPLTMLHPKDATLFAMLEKQCGWDLHELAHRALPDIDQPQVAAVTGGKVVRPPEPGEVLPRSAAR